MTQRWQDIALNRNIVMFQQQRVITQLLAERALLDERQRTRLMELLLNRYAQETTEEEQLHRD